MAYDLTAEIHAKLDELAERGDTWNAQWVAHAICSEHAEGVVEDDDHCFFWRHCGYEKTRDEVRRAINKRAGDKEQGNDDPQLRLPGYDHLQAYYIIRREGEDVGIPVTQLTDEELRGKADLYRAMAESCYAHADELDRFRRLRSAAA